MQNSIISQEPPPQTNAKSAKRRWNGSGIPRPIGKFGEKEVTREAFMAGTAIHSWNLMV